MLHGKAELGIMDHRPRAGRFGRNDDQAAVDLRAVVHARRILLADIAALGEADSAQLGGIGLEPEYLVRAELGAAFGHAERETMGAPGAFGGTVRRGGEPAAAELRQA